jgi:hypothetical protein
MTSENDAVRLEAWRQVADGVRQWATESASATQYDALRRLAVQVEVSGKSNADALAAARQAGREDVLSVVRRIAAEHDGDRERYTAENAMVRAERSAEAAAALARVLRACNAATPTGEAR